MQLRATTRLRVNLHPLRREKGHAGHDRSVAGCTPRVHVAVLPSSTAAPPTWRRCIIPVSHAHACPPSRLRLRNARPTGCTRHGPTRRTQAACSLWEARSARGACLHACLRGTPTSVEPIRHTAQRGAAAACTSTSGATSGCQRVCQRAVATRPTAASPTRCKSCTARRGTNLPCSTARRTCRLTVLACVGRGRRCVGDAVAACTMVDAPLRRGHLTRARAGQHSSCDGCCCCCC
jgi:hypothetical protein